MINSGKEQQYYDISSYFDENGLFCVEGWINQAAGQIPAREVDPIILPKASHISTLLIRNFHERLFTAVPVRTGKYWLIGAKLCISLVYKSVACLRLRRSLETQKMADFPTDRIAPGLPFTSVGVDAFRPWLLTTR